MLPPHQLRHTNCAPAYILPDHVTCNASWDTHVDTEEESQTVFRHYTRFSGSLSSLDITNGNRSHNKPLELI